MIDKFLSFIKYVESDLELSIVNIQSPKQRLVSNYFENHYDIFSFY